MQLKSELAAGYIDNNNNNINVAGFGNTVERNFVLSTKSKQNEHFSFAVTVEAL